jgi:hypothetical protein
MSLRPMCVKSDWNLDSRAAVTCIHAAVLGYIVAGTAVYQVEGQTEQTLPAGSAFYEAADTVIANFGNASDTEAMTFVAFYLLDGDQELIRC